MNFNLQQEYIEACDQVNRLAQTLKERDAEIERLKAEVKDLLEQNAEWQKALVEAIEKRDKLITELAK